jgi:anti-anti-sigma regulatory factor
MTNDKFTREEKDGAAILNIKSAMSVYEIASIRDELAACFKSHDKVILDVDEVGNCDTAGVQLMLSAFRMAENAGKTFEVRGASDSVRKSAVDLGLHPIAIGLR